VTPFARFTLLKKRNPILYLRHPIYRFHGKKYRNESHYSFAAAMEEIGHFPMCENPIQFKKYLMPVLGKILKAR
jgi:hypothetical protein